MKIRLAGVQQAGAFVDLEVSHPCGVGAAERLHLAPGFVATGDLAAVPGVVERSLQDREVAVRRGAPGADGVGIVGCVTMALLCAPPRAKPRRLLGELLVPLAEPSGRRSLRIGGCSIMRVSSTPRSTPFAS
jgi:hypothetical protein